MFILLICYKIKWDNVCKICNEYLVKVDFIFIWKVLNVYYFEKCLLKN